MNNCPNKNCLIQTSVDYHSLHGRRVVLLDLSRDEDRSDAEKLEVGVRHRHATQSDVCQADGQVKRFLVHLKKRVEAVTKTGRVFTRIPDKEKEIGLK